MRLRVILKEDLLEADKLQQSILNPDKKKRYRPFSYIRKQFERFPSLFVGCYDKGKVVGVMFGYVKKNKVLLGEVAISEEYRKKGIGNKMLDFFEAKAGKLGKKRIILGSKEEAESFYLRRGYMPILFVQIYHSKVPKSYRNSKFNVIGETNYLDAKRLFIRVDRYDTKLKEKAKREFDAYNVIYLYEKKL